MKLKKVNESIENFGQVRDPQYIISPEVQAQAVMPLSYVDSVTKAERKRREVADMIKNQRSNALGIVGADIERDRFSNMSKEAIELNSNKYFGPQAFKNKSKKNESYRIRERNRDVLTLGETAYKQALDLIMSKTGVPDYSGGIKEVFADELKKDFEDNKDYYSREEALRIYGNPERYADKVLQDMFDRFEDGELDIPIGLYDDFVDIFGLTGIIDKKNESYSIRRSVREGRKAGSRRGLKEDLWDDVWHCIKPAAERAGVYEDTIGWDDTDLCYGGNCYNYMVQFTNKVSARKFERYIKACGVECTDVVVIDTAPTVIFDATSFVKYCG